MWSGARKRRNVLLRRHNAKKKSRKNLTNAKRIPLMILQNGRLKVSPILVV
jgi:hypothetical protein